MNGQEKTSSPSPLCANGCGFYGNPTTKNLCSQCYRAYLSDEERKQENQLKRQDGDVAASSNLFAMSPSSPSTGVYDEIRSAVPTEGEQQSGLLASSAFLAPLYPAVRAELDTTEVASSLGDPLQQSGEAPQASENPVDPPPRNRCFQCHKKVGLLGFACRCGLSFCSSHRYADQHNCQFDYRELARRQLSKANQKVVADKLNRI